MLFLTADISDLTIQDQNWLELTFVDVFLHV